MPDTAQRKADKRKGQGRKQRYVDKRPALKRTIIRLLTKGWSPDLIAGRFKRLKEPYLNQESVYQFVYSLVGRKLNLRQYLRRAHRIRIPKAGRKTRKDSGIPHRKLPKKARRTMTYDNGREAAAHEAVTTATGMKFFFARTYASWQRGTNENRNGLVRFYLPRGTDLNRVTHGQVRRVENLINNRPMKILGYQTPHEAFAIEMNKLLLRSRPRL